MNNKGFSLVEVLVAIALISIALWSLVVILGSGFDGIFTSAHRNQAIYHAQDDIEEKLSIVEEGDIGVEGTIPGEVEINIGGHNIPSNGVIVIGEGEEKSVSSTMVTFVPEEGENGE